MKERYFSHDANARVDPKIIKLRMRYGMEGYGIYFAILEMMSLEGEHEMPYTDDQFDAIAFDLHTNVPMGEFVVYCVSIGLFVERRGVFWSESFKRRQDEMTEKTSRRSESAAKAAAARWNRGREDVRPTQENAPTGPSRPPESVDEGWQHFAEAYEQQIGLIPRDKVEALSDYYDAFGEDVMMLALEQTVKAKPDKPAHFMVAILQRWIEDGVDSIQKAKAAVLDHDRAVEQKKGKAREPTQAQPPIDVGKFF